ncbi:hypothetical protein Pyrfu_1145 [Pyrolobus fumarii 1A]|uniref:MobA-like NTP transferase domain-containing protein n=1 Tax=Pyrolobus fumarii (strain DSM 11204 / 1A) TaxID=694429 RepID=G0EFI6_PYRF1|nr:NTP transferase domain-containing protein [Pyrolobus fumarii]AEM39010.1 hypothetical protein Pyrfu_1145 [Pyrolobus fumarii 1A]
MLLAVVLAGGAATRLPGKLATVAKHGEKLLRHVVRVASLVADEVVVVARGYDPRWGLHRYVTVYDDPFFYGKCAGPLAGILSALGESRAWRVLVLSGDYGLVTPMVIEALVEAHRGRDTATILWCNGLIEPLLTVTSRSTLERVKTLCRTSPGLKPRPTLVHRLAETLLLLPISHLAVDPVLLASINTPWDLVTPRPKARAACRMEPRVHKPPLASLPFGRLGEPNVLLAEARYWLEHNVNHLALHAALDAEALGATGAEALAREARGRLGLERLHQGSVARKGH